MTNKTIEAAGFIVHDTEGLIHGFGATADDADADMRRTMAQANITILANDDSTEQLGSWTLESDMRVRPASAALLQAVKDMGGNRTWSTVGGVAVTRDEAED